MSEHVTQGNMGDLMVYAKHYRKKVLTAAVRMPGPFTVVTREGTLACPDGYLAVDAHGWPYPIARDEFEAIYEQVDTG
jgi:hypothetical protein